LQRYARRPGAAKKRRLSYNSRTLLWLLLCFPVGLTRMWRAACSWKPGVKYAVSSLAVAALAAVLLLPSPAVGVQGSITLLGDEPAVEVYGPQLPENYVLTNRGIAGESVIVPEEELVDNRFFVYVGQNAKCYHLESCDYAYDTAKKLTIYEAYYAGYKQCDICNPPAYSGAIDQV